QRRMRSWLVVRLAAALAAGFFVLFVDAARFFVDAAVFLECGRPARAGRASRPSAFAVRRRAERAADAAETAALRFFVFVFVALFRSISLEKRLSSSSWNRKASLFSSKASSHSSHETRWSDSSPVKPG